MNTRKNKVVPVVLVLLLLVYVVHQPTQAATTAGHLWDWLGIVADGVGRFFDAFNHA